MDRTCAKCNKDKEEIEFLARKSKRGTICRSCRAEYHKTWYHKTKNHRIEKKRHWNKITRARRREIIINYFKTHPCVDCGEDDYVVLEFDHLRGKIGNVSELTSIDKILEEIQKCEVRCANCHRRITAKRGGWYSNQASLAQKKSTRLTSVVSG